MRILHSLPGFILSIAIPVSPVWSATIRGTVFDPSGAVVRGAEIRVVSSQGSVLGQASSEDDGRFQLTGVSPGVYVVRVESAGLQPKSLPVTVGAQDPQPLDARLDLVASATQVSVIAELGGASFVQESQQMVSVHDRPELLRRPLVNIGQILDASPGLTAQETTRGQVSLLMRGLTGYQALLLVDGIRYNTSIFRSGPNQYLAWIDPAQSQGIEAVLGPSSSRHGSDSLGGTINVGTPIPRYATEGGVSVHGQAGLWGSSADMAAGGDLLMSVGTPCFSWILEGNGRKLNDLRGGGGTDSRNAFRRFLGMSDDAVTGLLGSRMQDTGFAQIGFQNKVAVRPSATHSLTLQHMFSGQRNVRSYRDRIGGVGRLQALTSPQRLNFGYVRYEKIRVGFLDSLAGTFSINSQVDGYKRQDLRPVNPVIQDNSRVNAFGYSGQGKANLGPGIAVVFGGDVYRELIVSTRFTYNPVNGVTTQNRALYPNNSRYITSGLFIQGTAELVPQKLRALVGGRWTRAGFRTTEAGNRDSSGASLGVTDSFQSFQFFSFNSSLTYQITKSFSVSGLIGRGIRAPNATDLSSIGVTTLGFDVAASDARAVSALVGTDGSESAASTRRLFGSLRAENLTSYELGVRHVTRRLYLRVQGFDSELKDPLVGRTLVFPVGGVPGVIGGYAVRALPQTPTQAQQGVVTVATSLTPRAVRSIANEGAIRYYGLESHFQFRASRQWHFESNYAYLAGRELFPNRPVRRLPPQRLNTSVRYAPNGRMWLETVGAFTGSQYRMNAGDYDDDRMGASRNRNTIADFFAGGYASQYVSPGADGRLGTADDLFDPSRETLRQIQDRLLPLGSVINGVIVSNATTRVPLYLGSANWWSVGVRGGYSLTERLTLNTAVMNLTDNNYRIHGSGTDAPGIDVSVSVRYVF
ncbi:MAG: TonB-dependent receptor domain-containing protein [Bryobacteraceae bacterium]